MTIALNNYLNFWPSILISVGIATAEAAPKQDPFFHQ